MRIKQQLLLGTGSLFAMILALTAVSIFHTNRLSTDTKNILVANFNSIDYCRKMQLALDDGIVRADNMQLFTQNLHLQQNNITESGEKELTKVLATAFNRLVQQPADSALIYKVRKSISDIMLLNMQAIHRKSTLAENTAEKSIFWVTLIGTICFIIGLTLWFNLPGYIANPIQELTESIKDIARQNYSRRIVYNKPNEFGEVAASFNTMAQKLEEYKESNVQKLLLEKKRIETLINNLQDPVIGLDEYNSILFINEAGLSVSGLKLTEVAGKRVETIAGQNDLIRQLVQDLLQPGNKPDKQEPLKIFANNKESYFIKTNIPIKIVPTGEKAEKQMGNVILLQNITAYKELDLAKTNFVATVSHEFKTPIAAIKMSVQLLENEKIGTLNAEQKSLLNSIAEDAGRLLAITGELLHITQVESGMVQVAPTAANPVALVEAAMAATQKQADLKHIVWQFTPPETIPPVKADFDKTTWILTNLLSNAIRYSYDHTFVEIALNATENQMLFTVKDSGQGIAPQYLDKIFNRYYKVPGSKKEGTGLGLSISKAFIEAQGGTISVASEYGKGTTFTFSLPLAG
ncbi:MAG: ATP-binding protein [Chitinophagaceae bacterium]|jgi:signal transduction histidine kinase|nr:ATP-binding protein [Chitinophagaceae bacterium]